MIVLCKIIRLANDTGKQILNLQLALVGEAVAKVISYVTQISAEFDKAVIRG